MYPFKEIHQLFLLCGIAGLTVPFGKKTENFQHKIADFEEKYAFNGTDISLATTDSHYFFCIYENARSSCFLFEFLFS